MINGRNLTIQSGGLTRDAEYNEGIGLITLSLAVDNAGRQDGETSSGYFDVDIWVKPNDYSPVAVGKQVVQSLKDNLLVKGTKIEVVGRLMHDRFTTKDGQKASRVKIVAENVTVLYSKNWKGSGASEGGETAGDETPKAAEASGYTPEPF